MTLLISIVLGTDLVSHKPSQDDGTHVCVVCVIRWRWRWKGCTLTTSNVLEGIRWRPFRSSNNHHRRCWVGIWFLVHNRRFSFRRIYLPNKHNKNAFIIFYNHYLPPKKFIILNFKIFLKKNNQVLKLRFKI